MVLLSRGQLACLNLTLTMRVGQISFQVTVLPLLDLQQKNPHTVLGLNFCYLHACVITFTHSKYTQVQLSEDSAVGVNVIEWLYGDLPKIQITVLARI